MASMQANSQPQFLGGQGNFGDKEQIWGDNCLCYYAYSKMIHLAVKMVFVRFFWGKEDIGGNCPQVPWQ